MVVVVQLGKRVISYEELDLGGCTAPKIQSHDQKGYFPSRTRIEASSPKNGRLAVYAKSRPAFSASQTECKRESFNAS